MEEARTSDPSICPSKGSTKSEPELAVDSSSRVVSGVINKSDALNILKCPSCSSYLAPPIFQCSDGHPLCSECAGRTTICPSCRTRVTKFRCRPLERLAELIGEVACGFHDSGCRARFMLYKLRSHERKCAFRPFKCPAKDYPSDSPQRHRSMALDPHECQFEGSPKDLASHLADEHGWEQDLTSKIHIRVNPDILKPFWDNTTTNSGTHHVYFCHSNYYILRISSCAGDEPMLFISLMALTYKTPSNRYEVHLEGDDRRHSYEGPVWSLRRGFDEVEEMQDCLALRDNIAPSLAGEESSEDDWRRLEFTVSGEIFPDTPDSKVTGVSA